MQHIRLSAVHISVMHAWTLASDADQHVNRERQSEVRRACTFRFFALMGPATAAANRLEGPMLALP